MDSANALDAHGHTPMKRPYEGSSSESVVSFAHDNASAAQSSLSVANSVFGLDGKRSLKSTISTAGCRQRVTVVCAECKRLKLKCDRRAPCGSCTKRDTVPRCIYSQAASEKVDVQSLNIRLSAVEGKLSGISPASATSSTLGQPFSNSNSNSTPAKGGNKPRAFLAVGSHGASVAVSLEGVAGLWVDHLGLNTAAARAVSPEDGTARDWTGDTNVRESGNGNGMELRPFPMIPDGGVIDLLVDYTKLFRLPTSLVSRSSAGSDTSENENEKDNEEDYDEGDSGHIGVSPKLVLRAFPPAHIRAEIYPRFEAAHFLAPCVNFFIFRNRIEEMCRWAELELSGSRRGSRSRNGRSNERSNEPPPIVTTTMNSTSTSSVAATVPRPPTLSFFAAAAMGMALGMQCWLAEREMLGGDAVPSSPEVPMARGSSPATSSAVPGPGPSSSSNAFDRTMPPPPVPGPSIDRASTSSPAASSPSVPGPGPVPGPSSSTAQTQTPIQIDASLPGTLYRLAKVALGLSLERAGYEAFDLDYIHAKCLQARYLLLSRHGLGDGAGMLRGLGTGRRKRLARRGRGKTRERLQEEGDAVMDDVSAGLAGPSNTNTGAGTSGNGKGKAPVRGPTLALAPEMVGVVSDAVGNARMMGLNHDPDISGDERFSLYEKEMRRRLWWEIVSLDASVADCLGESPLINDDSATTKFPTDVDEESFGPDSANLPAPNIESLQGNIDYFIQRCRLTDLVKRLKRKASAFRELHPDADAQETHSIVEMLKGEIASWLASLPDHLKLKDVPPLDVTSAYLDVKLMSPMSRRASTSAGERENPAEADSPHLIAMRCDLAISARHFFLMLCLPFTRDPNGLNASTKSKTKAKADTDLAPASSPRSSEALALLEPAMCVVQVWKHLHTVLRHVRPSMFMCYAFTKELFDAAVVLGHLAIEQPLFAARALPSVRVAADVIRDPSVLTGRQAANECGTMPSEAVRIIEELVLKAEAAYVGLGSSSLGAQAIVKRKHEEVDVEGSDFLYHFRFPYVGTGVMSAGPPVYVSGPVRAVTPVTSPITDGGSVGGARGVAPSLSAAADASGVVTAGDPRPAMTKLKSSHPTIGVRNRKGKESSRARANSSASARSEVSHMLPPAHPPRASLPPPMHSLPQANHNHTHNQNHNVPPHRMTSVEPSTPLLGPSYAGPLSSTPGPGPGPPHYASPPLPVGGGGPTSSQQAAGEYPSGYHDAGFPGPSPTAYGPPFQQQHQGPPLSVPSQVGFDGFGVDASGPSPGPGQGGRMSMGAEPPSYPFSSTNRMDRPVSMHRSASYEAATRMTSLPRPPSESPQDHQFARNPVGDRAQGQSNQMAPSMQSLDQQAQQQPQPPPPPHPPQTYHPHPHPHPHSHSHSHSQAEPMVPQQGWSQNANVYSSWNPYYQ